MKFTISPGVFVVVWRPTLELVVMPRPLFARLDPLSKADIWWFHRCVEKWRHPEPRIIIDDPWFDFLNAALTNTSKRP